MPFYEKLLETQREKRMEKDRSPLHLFPHLRPRFKDSHFLGLLSVTGNTQYLWLTIICVQVGVPFFGHGKWAAGAWIRALGDLYTIIGYHLK